jgi:hypothetical protein
MDASKGIFVSSKVSKSSPPDDHRVLDAADVKVPGGARRYAGIARGRATDPLLMGVGLLTTVAALAFVAPPIGLLLGLCAYDAIFRGTIYRWTKD